MDKLTTISATLFMAADVFAIVSLALPDWIITEEAGNNWKKKQQLSSTDTKTITNCC